MYKGEYLKKIADNYQASLLKLITRKNKSIFSKKKFRVNTKDLNLDISLITIFLKKIHELGLMKKIYKTLKDNGVFITDFRTTKGKDLIGSL